MSHSGDPHEPPPTRVERLLDRPAPEGYRRDWTQRIAAKTSGAVVGTQSLMVFHLGGEWLALPTALLQEVAENCPAHSMPHHAGSVLRGVVTIRGELLILVSLAQLLRLPDNVAFIKEPLRKIYPQVLVVGRGNDRLVFAVDQVQGVERYHPAELLPVPATLASAGTGYTTGLLQRNGRIIGCLDVDLVLYTLRKSIT